MEASSDKTNIWVKAAKVEKVPFKVFQDANLNYFNKSGTVTFKYDTGAIASRRIELYIYSYFVTPGSKNRNFWTIQGAKIGSFPDIYQKTLGVHNIAWKFTKEKGEETDLLLVYIKGNGHIARSEFICGAKPQREDISRLLKPLASAARKYGMPRDGIGITHVFDEDAKPNGNNREISSNAPTDDRYFRVLGIIPTTNIGLVKAAYRELAKQFHPDTNTGISQNRMKEINEAYEHIISILEVKKG